MKRFTFGLIFIIFVVFSFAECQKWNSNGGRTSSNGKKSPKSGSYYSNEDANGEKLAEVNGPIKSQAVKSSPRGGVGGGGIGAWGYVSIILFVILSGLGIYYTILFYPIVCKKQRMYHVMGSTTV